MKDANKKVESTLEDILSSLLKDDLISYIESHPNKIGDLIQLAHSNKPPHSPRAAYLLSKIASQNKLKIKPHVLQILDIIPQVRDGQKRDLITILTAIDLNEEEEGMLYDLCVNLWIDLNKIPSVRFKAFNFILKICKKYPDLKNELSLITENYYLESLSSGIKRVILRMINDFKKEN